MSHIPQRKEKDCLNCGTIVQGKYCQNCGQENVEPHESFWHMVTHFFYDITHFDSSFFHTIHHLILKPGFLSKEYVRGKRMSYLHPIRMYVFTSAIFFLLFFSVFLTKDSIKLNMDTPLDAASRAGYVQKLEQILLKTPGDSILQNSLRRARDSGNIITHKDALAIKEMNFSLINFSDKVYKTREEYDSIQRSLPAAERDGWFMRRLIKKEIEINRAYRQDPDGTQRKFFNSVLHRLPYMLFVSLPLFALILKLVYIRRKQFYFFDHGVFTIHLYIFSFLLLIILFCFDKLEKLTNWGGFAILMVLLFLSLFFYLYKGMRNFYGQRRFKTFLKFLLVALLSLVMMLILFVFFAFFSAVIF